jgi:hypothetical protein
MRRQIEKAGQGNVHCAKGRAETQKGWVVLFWVGVCKTFESDNYHLMRQTDGYSAEDCVVEVLERVAPA